MSTAQAFIVTGKLRVSTSQLPENHFFCNTPRKKTLRSYYTTRMTHCLAIIVSKFLLTATMCKKSWPQLSSCMQTNDEGDKVALLIEEIIRVIWVKVFFWTVTKCNSVVNTKLPTKGASLKLSLNRESSQIYCCRDVPIFVFLKGSTFLCKIHLTKHF